MFSVRTVLKSGSKFVQLGNWVGRVPDPDYVEGAIILSNAGRVVLDESFWDDVNYLWPFIVDGLSKLAEGDDFQTGFPDQPITFSVTHVSRDWVLLRVFSKDDEFLKLKIPKIEFLLAMISGAREFLLKMLELCPGEESSHIYHLKILDSTARKL